MAVTALQRLQVRLQSLILFWIAPVSRHPSLVFRLELNRIIALQISEVVKVMIPIAGEELITHVTIEQYRKAHSGYFLHHHPMGKPGYGTDGLIVESEHRSECVKEFAGLGVYEAPIRTHKFNCRLDVWAFVELRLCVPRRKGSDGPVRKFGLHTGHG